jgi:iron complex outermembrane receptor protein
VTLAGKHEFSDRLRVKGRIGVANSDYSRCPSRSRSSSIATTSTATPMTPAATSRKPIITYGFDVTNPALFTLTEMRSRESSIAQHHPHRHRATWSTTSTTHLTLKAGVNAQQFVAKYRDASRNQTLTGANQIVGVGAFSKVVSFGRDFPFPGGDRSYVVADIDKAVAYTHLLDFPLIVQPGDTRDVAEDDLSGYGQAIVNTTVLGGMPLRSDFGARVAQTKVECRRASSTPPTSRPRTTMSTCCRR